MIDFDTFTKLPKNVRDLGKLIIPTGLKKLPKVQKIAQSGHTATYWQHLKLFDRGRSGSFKKGAQHLLTFLPDGDTNYNFGYCPSCTFSNVLAFHIHKSLPLGQIQAFIRFNCTYKPIIPNIYPKL